MPNQTGKGRVRIGVIGVGQIGKNHLNNYTEKCKEEVDVVAVADINLAEAQRVGTLYGIETVTTNFRDLLKRDDITAVDVCLHNNYHAPVTIEALQAGKHVYCEKPMAGAYIDAVKMMETARETGQMLSIQLATLFANETKAARWLIDQGMLGKVYHARSTGYRRRGRPYVDGYGTSSFVQKEIASGGALYDMGVYHIARMLWLLDNPEVKRISGKVYQEMDMDPVRQANGRYDVEELGLGFVKLANDMTLDIIEAWAVNLDKFEGSAVLGAKAGIRLDPFGYFNSVGDLDFNTSVDTNEFSKRLHFLRENADAYDSAQQHWAAVLQGRVPLLPTAELALNTMLIQEGIFLSDSLGREVSADEVEAMSVSTAKKV
jgi:predicted dehydrogenase